MAFTFFFRDIHTLELLMEHAVPVFRGQSFIRVWDAGCAYGPEPYTLTILFREAMSEFIYRNLKVHATDIDTTEQFGTKIRNGVYTKDEVGRIPKNVLDKYFTKIEPDRFQLCTEIMSHVEFEKHDLLTLKPIRQGFSLIVCKNVLLHFKPEMRIKVINMFHKSLREKGFLVMENTQELPEEFKKRFTKIAVNSQIFIKN